MDYWALRSVHGRGNKNRKRQHGPERNLLIEGKLTSRPWRLRCFVERPSDRWFHLHDVVVSSDRLHSLVSSQLRIIIIVIIIQTRSLGSAGNVRLPRTLTTSSAPRLTPFLGGGMAAASGVATFSRWASAAFSAGSCVRDALDVASGEALVDVSAAAEAGGSGLRSDDGQLLSSAGGRCSVTSIDVFDAARADADDDFLRPAADGDDLRGGAMLRGEGRGRTTEMNRNRPDSSATSFAGRPAALVTMMWCTRRLWW